MKPDAVIGTGGYASGPVLLMAQRMGIPTVVQEQNSYAGITNIRLGKKAKYICTAYENAARFFPTDRVRLTGNPVREVFTRELPDHVASKSAMGFDPNKKLLLVLGGSLGARAINRQMAKSLADIKAQGWQVMWQCGKLYEEEYQGMTGDGTKVQAFIEDMSMAYASADAIVSRAGAGTLSELCLIGKPALLIPSPNVAEDHQTHNARALSEKGAAILVSEKDMEERFLEELASMQNEEIAEKMSVAIKGLALPKATSDIADLIDDLGE
jgi:UDP-N-acetylglucosamine--N-acetylmuramyl-(pentapeptide) pyrophosphoryl-undecaprenol N-acetylglucosamine transferase